MDPITAAATATALTLAAVGFAVLYLRRRVDLKREVLVVLRSGETVRGVLLDRRGDRLVLGSAWLLSQGSETSIDGTVEVDRDNVTWVQVP